MVCRHKPGYLAPCVIELGAVAYSAASPPVCLGCDRAEAAIAEDMGARGLDAVRAPAPDRRLFNAMTTEQLALYRNALIGDRDQARSPLTVRFCEDRIAALDEVLRGRGVKGRSVAELQEKR